MNVSKELISALTVIDRPELLISLDENTRGDFFKWCREQGHTELIEPMPAWESLRHWILKTGECPPGIVVSDGPTSKADDYYLEMTEPAVPTKEEADGPSSCS